MNSSRREKLSDVATGLATVATILSQKGYSNEATWFLIGSIIVVVFKNFWD